MNERSLQCGESEDGGVFLMEKHESSYDANGNSTILSIMGELTETSGDFMWPSKPLSGLRVDW